MSQMKNTDFNLLKAKAEVYANEYLDSRIFLFAVGKTADEFPLDFQEVWDIDNADVHIHDAMAEFVFRGISEFQSAFDCFFMEYYDAELYHSGKCEDAFTTPAEDGIITRAQETEVRELMYTTLQKSIDKSEWRGECFLDALTYRKAQQSLMNEVNNLIK
jgi:hypothetical protein